MESTSSRVAVTIAALAILFLIGYVIWARTNSANTANTLEAGMATTTNEGTLATSSSDVSTHTLDTTTERVQLALLDTHNFTQGKQRGCDRIVMVPYRIGAAAPSLDTAMRALFSWDEENVGDWLNFVARIRNTVTYSHTTVDGTTATVFLTGDFPETAGSCDDQRLQAQIEETAYQFPRIQKVHIYLNGAPTDITDEATE